MVLKTMVYTRLWSRKLWVNFFKLRRNQNLKNHK